MTQSEQAVLLWPVLALAARNQQILSYADLEGLTGIDRRGLGQTLILIHSYCESKHFPLLNLIVVSRETGLPGDGVPGQPRTPEQYFVEQSKVFVFDWSGKEKPRSQSFSVPA